MQFSKGRKWKNLLKKNVKIDLKDGEKTTKEKPQSQEIYKDNYLLT